MFKITLCSIGFLVFSCSLLSAQQEAVSIDERTELYISQLAAAEALYQLNKISEASNYLNSCSPELRNVEWDFLKSAIDRSERIFDHPKAEHRFNSIQLSPDKKILAAAGSDSIIYLYTYPELSLKAELKAHSASVSTIAFSSDGEYLASGGRDHRIIVWAIETETILFANERDFSQGIYQLKFTPDNLHLGVVSWERDDSREPGIFGFFKLIDIKTELVSYHIELDNHPASNIQFSPDGQYVYLSTWGEIAYCYKLKNNEIVWKYDLSDWQDYNAFHSMDISPDGKLIALGSTDSKIHFLEAATGKHLHSTDNFNGHNKIIKAIRFSENGNYLASASEDQRIIIWNTSDFSKKTQLTGHLNSVVSLEWSNNEEYLISSSLDGTLRTWNLENTFEKSSKICGFGPWQLPLNNDKSAFAAPCSDEKFALYDVNSAEEIANLGAFKGLCADFSKSGNLVASADFNGVVRVWNIASNKLIHTFNGHNTRVDGLTFFDNDNKIASVGAKSMKIWNLTKSEEEKTVNFEKAPFRICCSADETMLIVSFGNQIKAFDSKSLKVSYTLICNGDIQEMAVSPNDSYLAVFGGKNIEIFGLKTGNKITILSGHEKSGYALDFSPDEKYLVTGSYDQTLRFWNLDDFTCRIVYHGIKDTIYSVKFISDHQILCGGPEGNIWIHNFSNTP